MGEEDRQPDKGGLGPEGLQRAAGAVPAAALAEVGRDRRHPHRRRLARPALPAPGRHGQGSAEGRHRAALPRDHRGEHGQRTPRRAARLHRRGPALLPQGFAGEVREEAPHDLAGADGDGEGRSGRGAQGKNTGTLGGWQWAVSKYSKNAKAAVDLAMYLTSPEEEKRAAIEVSFNPTIPALYKDKDILAKNPFIGELLPTFQNAVARPSRATKSKYNQVSSEFWNAVHEVLSGKSDAEASISKLEKNLNRISRNGKW